MKFSMAMLLGALALGLLIFGACRRSAPVADAPVAFQKERAALEGQVAFAPQESPWTSGFRVRLRFLAEDVAAGRTVPAAGRDALQALKKDIDLVAAGQSGELLKPETSRLMGCRSEIDGSDQPFFLQVPKEHDGKTPLPLVVFLHGQGMFNPRQFSAPALDGAYVVGPQGRGGMDWMFVAEPDVLAVVAQARRLLPVDGGRIYLAGASMGGTGSWHLAACYPDLFAGFIAVTGLMDVRALDTLSGSMILARLSQGSPRRFLIEDTSALTYAGNLLNHSIIAGHGLADPINPASGAIAMQERLCELGHPALEAHLYPYLRHGLDFDYQAALDRILEQPRPAVPLKIRHSAAWLRYGQAYWLRIAGFERRLARAEVEAVADPETRSLSFATRNVSRLEILSDRLPFSGSPRQVVVDGVVLATEATWPAQGNAWAGKDVSGKWQWLAPQVERLHKTAVVEGAVEHAYMSSFIVVGPDAAALARHEPTAQAAQAAAERFCELWQKLFSVPCRLFQADTVGPEEIASASLVLYGGPVENSLVAKIQDRLPLRLSAAGIGLAGQHYSGTSLGLRLCYPNPLNPGRYVVLNQGTDAASYHHLNERFGHWFHWVPFFHREHYDYAVYDVQTQGADSDTFVAWGFFDEAWQVDPKLCFPGKPLLRSLLRPYQAPDLAWEEVAASQPERVPLDRLGTIQEITLKGCVERRRGPKGETLCCGPQTAFAAGLAVPAPGSLQWKCQGYARATIDFGILWDGREPWSKERLAAETATAIVTLDGKEVWRQAFTRDSPPVHLQVLLGKAGVLGVQIFGSSPWGGGVLVLGNPELRLHLSPAGLPSR